MERKEDDRSQLPQQPRQDNKPPPDSHEPLAQAPTSAPFLLFLKEKLGIIHEQKQKLTKDDIGFPSDFKHVSHVGWDPNKGFVLENVDPTLLQFFARAGVSETHLQDKATCDFICDFIDKHGGMEAVLCEGSQTEFEAGVSETHLQDKATRDFIYDFIDKHGGMEAALREGSQTDGNGST